MDHLRKPYQQQFLELLVLILDANPVFWVKRLKAGQSRGFDKSLPVFPVVLATVLMFLNSFLMTHRDNMLAVLSANAGKSSFLWPERGGRSTTESLRPRFKDIDRGVASAIKKIACTKDREDDNASLGAALSKAMCVQQSQRTRKWHRVAPPVDTAWPR